MEAKTWEDTVMPVKERIKFGVWNGRERQAEAQAEISYKVGYDKALTQLADMTEECKQMGRKEVVEWLDDKTPTWRQYLQACVSREEYKAKLKEWGIE